MRRGRRYRYRLLLAGAMNSVRRRIGSCVPQHACSSSGRGDGPGFLHRRPASGATERSSGCEPVRLPFKVVDNQITGSLQRATYGAGRVEGGSGSTATPISGTVQPGGSFTTHLENDRGTGKLVGNTAGMSWSGECGARKATGGRAKALPYRLRRRTSHHGSCASLSPFERAPS